MALHHIGRETFMAQGRLSLASNTPVMTGNVTSTTVYYTPYVGNAISLYTGSEWLTYPFQEMSQVTTDAIKSPAATAINSVYDMFVWRDVNVLRCTRGPAWTSLNARGTGAGTSELERVNGIYLNKIAITNGPAALRGTYVGSVATNAANSIEMFFVVTPAAGGNGNRLSVWNNYNRRLVAAICRDSTDSWNYTTATLRPLNNSTSNSITMLGGLVEDRVTARASVNVVSDTLDTSMILALGYDSTTAMHESCLPGHYECSRAGASATLNAFLSCTIQLGVRRVQVLEYSEATGTTTWFGDAGTPTIRQSGLHVEFAM